jgi:hypothetical protein
MGRQRKQHAPLAPLPAFDEDAVAQVVGLVRTGVSLEGAIGYSGLAKTTFYRWCTNGRRWPDTYVREAELVRQLDEALGQFEATAMLGIRRAAESSWQAWAWMLERRFPDRYSRMIKQDVSITASSDDPRIAALHQAGFEGDATLLDEGELEQLIALLYKAIPEEKRRTLGLDTEPLPVIEMGGANGQEDGQAAADAA